MDSPLCSVMKETSLNQLDHPTDSDTSKILTKKRDDITNQQGITIEPFKMTTQTDQVQQQPASSQNQSDLQIVDIEEVNTIREIAIHHAIEVIDQLSFNDLEVAESAISILSYLIPQTTLKFEEFSNYILAFAINQACFPRENKFTPYQMVTLVESGRKEFEQCFGVYHSYVPNFPASSSDPNISLFDKLHSELLRLLQNSNNELTQRFALENTTFAHLIKIIQRVDDLNDNDFIEIKDLIEVYWIHEQLFNNYSSKIVAYTILKVLQFSDNVEFDFSSFGNLVLIQQISSPKQVQEFKQCCIDFFNILEMPLPEKILLEFGMQCEQVFEENKNDMSIEEEEEQFQEELGQNKQENESIEDFQIEVSSIRIQSSCDNASSTNKKTSISNFKLNNSMNEEKTPLIYQTSQFHNNQPTDFIITSTPEKKPSALNQQESSFMLTDSFGKQMSNSLFHTQDTKSTSISNFSMNTDESKNCNLKAIRLSPSPFNPNPNSIYHHISELHN